MEITRVEACRMIVCDRMDEELERLIEKFGDTIVNYIPVGILKDIFRACRRLYLEGRCGIAIHRPALTGAIFYYIFWVISGKGTKSTITQSEIKEVMDCSDGVIQKYVKFFKKTLKGGLPDGINSKQE